MPARGRRSSSPRSSAGHRYPRSARVSETLREIIADELVRIDDERLVLVTVTQIEVDNELNRAIVFYDSLAGPDGDGEILAALGEHRVRLQSSIARQIRAKKTPILDLPSRQRDPLGGAHRGASSGAPASRMRAGDRVGDASDTGPEIEPG